MCTHSWIGQHSNTQRGRPHLWPWRWIRYGIDLAALHETILPGYDSMEDHGYIFFWSCKSANEKREAGVGFALKKEIAATLDKEA